MPFLYNAFGIEMAARTYFDKPAQKLTCSKAQRLIAMLKGTSYYNPVLNPERALRRRNVVLAQMVKRGVLSQAEFDRLKIPADTPRFRTPAGSHRPRASSCRAHSQMADRLGGPKRSQTFIPTD